MPQKYIRVVNVRTRSFEVAVGRSTAILRRARKRGAAVGVGCLLLWRLRGGALAVSLCRARAAAVALAATEQDRSPWDFGGVLGLGLIFAFGNIEHFIGTSFDSQLFSLD